jgi:hypothetical protein
MAREKGKNKRKEFAESFLQRLEPRKDERHGKFEFSKKDNDTNITRLIASSETLMQISGLFAEASDPC